MSACDFTYTHYEEILNKIEQTDYRVIFFNESNSHDHELILRHDVDVDLESAYKLALIENRHKIRATYFVLIRSPFYNIFDRSNSDLIKGILDMGHQIGLHFDEAYYGVSDAECIIKNVASEVQVLKDSFGANIFAVSFHRPSPFILQSDIRLSHNLINTYDRNFTKAFKYISDSRRLWKDGCLCHCFEKNSDEYPNPKIQALVHPLWWTEKSRSAQDTLENLLLKKLKTIDNELKNNIQIYKKLYD